MKDLFRGILTLVILFYSGLSYSQQTVSSPQFRREFLEEINHVRQRGCNCGITYMPPAPPLVWNEQLEFAAIGHAVDMANQNYFSHTSLDGRNMRDRMAAVGYTMDGYRSFNIGENIAMGQQSIAEVMNGWFKSAGHCKNLMNPQFKEIGIAEYHDYWVQDFGGRDPFSAEMQKLIKSGKYRIIQGQ
jgi:uncharacterized protein YkwD